MLPARRWLGIPIPIVACSVVALAAVPAHAEQERTEEIEQVEVRGRSIRGAVGDVSPATSSDAWGPGWRVRYAQSVVYATTYMGHNYAKTERLEGGGGYGTHAHATLIKGHDYGGQQVFSSFTHSCASRTETNVTAQTCRSPNQASSSGSKWLLVSGHWYDHGNDGTKDGSCSGCIDWKWTHP